MHSITFVLIYGTIWRSWTWGSSLTWGVWSLNVIKDKTNTRTHTYTQTHTSAQEHTHTQIHSSKHTNTQSQTHKYTYSLDYVMSYKKSRGSSWMGGGLMGVLGAEQWGSEQNFPYVQYDIDICQRFASFHFQAWAMRGTSFARLLLWEFVTKCKICVWWDSSIVSQSGGKRLGHFRNKGFWGKGFRFGREWPNKSF